MDFRDLSVFIAVVAEGSLSAAARKLGISQPSLSQAIRALEIELGVTLLERKSTGVLPTAAGERFLAEARALLAQRQQVLRTMTDEAGRSSSVIRIGIPLEMPPSVLPRALERLAVKHPDTQIQPRHLSSTAQISALRDGLLDLGLPRDRPDDEQFDSMLVIEEALGILVSTRVARRLGDADGVTLEALRDLTYEGFPRANCPAWHDQITAVLRSHGLSPGADVAADQRQIAAVKFAAVAGGRAFTLAPENWSEPLPEGVAFRRLVGTPLVRRTWAVWHAKSRRRDLGELIAAFDRPAPA